MNILKYLLLFLSIISINYYSQTLNVEIEKYTVTDGLSHGCVHVVFQDVHGFLWFGTEAGLNRYDGYNFKEYIHDSTNPLSISNNHVRAIYEDKSDSGRVLWIGTKGGGLSKFIYNSESFISYLNDPQNQYSISSNEINSITKIDNNYWIGTDNGLSIFNKNTEQFISYKHMSGDSLSLSSNLVTSVCQDMFGSIWISTMGGLNKIGNESFPKNLFKDIQPKKIVFKKFLHDLQNRNSLPTDEIFFVHEDNNNNLLVGTRKGLRIYNYKKDLFQQINFSDNNYNKLNDYQIFSFYENSRNEVWITTLGAGIFKLDINANKSWSLTTTDYKGNFSNSSISSMTIDRNGNIWAGNFCDGINKIYPLQNKFIHIDSFFDINLHDRNNWIFSITEYSNDVVLLGTNVGILLSYNWKKNEFLNYHFNDNNSINDICVRSTGEIWLARTKYLTTISSDFNSIKNYSVESLASVKDVYSEMNGILEDNQGRVWCLLGFVNDNKLYRLKSKNMKLIPFITINDQISKNISCMYNDREGNLWFGTQGMGLVKIFNDKTSYHLDSIKLFDLEQLTNISRVFIFSIIEGSDGHLYLGTDHGLIIFNKEQEYIEKIIRQKDGLPSNMISTVMEDSKNNLWLGTNRGLSAYSLRSSVIKNYGIRSGLPTVELGGSTCLKNSSDLIFYGGKYGLLLFHPDSLEENTTEPPIMITEFKVLSKDNNLSENLFPISGDVQKNSIVLSHNQNIILFEFAVLDYRDPENNKYAYKLEGVNNNWVYADASNRKVTYTNLSPGAYVFTVKGSNNNGIWNEKGTSFKIIILPPWWKTTWAYIIYAILAASLIYAIWRFQLNRYRLKHELELEHKHAKKLEEIGKMKSRFFANISHEFRTPLTLIIGPLEKLISESSKPEEKKTFEIMQKNSKKLLRLINQLLDLSRIENSNTKLQLKHQDIVAFTRGIVMSFSSLAERKQIKINFKTQSNISIYFDTEKIDKVIGNLLSNAIKFTNEGGEILVTIKHKHIYNKQYVELSIIDNGIGIPDNKLPKIFDRFYQVDESKTHEQEGTGIGLSLSKELVELHGGDISAESKLGVGATIKVLLPVEREESEGTDFITDGMEKIETSVDEEIIDLDQIEGTIDGQVSRFSKIRSKKLPLVLLIEDNADVRSYINDNIKDIYSITEAKDGEEGFKKALSLQPELIISDVMMPIMDGLELCNKLRNDERTSHIPIILLTARVEQDDKLEGLKTGADDYITKPFNFTELRARINNLIEKRKLLQIRFQKELGLNTEDFNLSSMDQDFIKRVIYTVEKNLSNPSFNVELLSNELSISRIHMNRKLQSITGTTSTEFIRTLRLKKAALLLKNETATVSEIAYNVGFNNLSYFSKCFKVQFECLPSQYKTYA